MEEELAEETEGTLEAEAQSEEKPKASKKGLVIEYIKRCLFLIVGLCIMAVGVVLSLIFLRGLQGVREGTVAAAIFVGMIAKQLNRFMVPFGEKLFRNSEKKRNGRNCKIVNI